MKKIHRILPWIPILNVIIILSISSKYVFSKEIENFLYVGVIWAGMIAVLGVAFWALGTFLGGFNETIVELLKIVILSICFSIGALLVTKRDERISK